MTDKTAKTLTSSGFFVSQEAPSRADGHDAIEDRGALMPFDDFEPRQQ